MATCPVFSLPNIISVCRLFDLLLRYSSRNTAVKPSFGESAKSFLISKTWPGRILRNLFALLLRSRVKSLLSITIIPVAMLSITSRWAMVTIRNRSYFWMASTKQTAEVIIPNEVNPATTPNLGKKTTLNSTSERENISKSIIPHTQSDNCFFMLLSGTAVRVRNINVVATIKYTIQERANNQKKGP